MEVMYGYVVYNMEVFRIAWSLESKKNLWEFMVKVCYSESRLQSECREFGPSRMTWSPNDFGVVWSPNAACDLTYDLCLEC